MFLLEGVVRRSEPRFHIFLQCSVSSLIYYGRDSKPIGGDYMSDVSASTRRFAEKSAAQTKSAFNKSGAAIAEEARRAEHNASTAMNGVRECYLKVLGMAQEKELSDLAQKVATSSAQPLTNRLMNPLRRAS